MVSNLKEWNAFLFERSNSFSEHFYFVAPQKSVWIFWKAIHDGTIGSTENEIPEFVWSWFGVSRIVPEIGSSDLSGNEIFEFEKEIGMNWNLKFQISDQSKSFKIHKVSEGFEVSEFNSLKLNFELQTLNSQTVKLWNNETVTL